MQDLLVCACAVQCIDHDGTFCNRLSHAHPDHTYIYTPYFCMFVSLYRYLVYTCYQSWPLTLHLVHLREIRVSDLIDRSCMC